MAVFEMAPNRQATPLWGALWFIHVIQTEGEFTETSAYY